MSKILVVNLIYVFIFFGAYSQVDIKKISGNVNSVYSDFSFLRVNDSLSFFTNSEFNNKGFKSNIYMAERSDDRWTKKQYLEFSEDINWGNMTTDSYNSFYYYSGCNNDNSNCDIMFSNNTSTQNLSRNYPQIFQGSYNSQPHFFIIRNQKFLSFVSNRSDGYGGLDIWFCLIDNKGLLGIPLNAGPNINSKYDEITPYYNLNDSSLYFSTNSKENSLGGFDVFYAKGIPNNWSDKINLLKINTNHDEMYLNFYTENLGYFASNRTVNSTKNIDSCCNNIYEFKTIPSEKNYNTKPAYSKFLPLNLYFDNNKPNPLQKNIANINSYKKTYVNYFIRRGEYILKSQDSLINFFFEDSLKGNFNKLNKLFDKLAIDLKSGNTINIKLKGFASQLADTSYNISLSSLRIKSIISYFMYYNDGEFYDYIVSDKLKFTEVPLGESEAFSSSNTSLQKIYGLKAILNRKVSIIKIENYK